MDRRVEFVLRLRLQGAESWDIHPLVNADGDPWPDGHGPAWGVSIETIRRYLRLADGRLAEVADRRREEFVNRHLAQRRMLYARAVQQADYRAALAVLDSEAKLLDLFPRANKDDGAGADAADRVTIELPPKDGPPEPEAAADAPG
ncbi:MAG: hypothetical protein U0804_02765 [Gemmataceae bacterium]